MDNILEIKGLKKSFSGKKVLDGIDLTIKPGEIIGYIGPNGAGKSTTVKIILGLISSYEGEVKVFSRDIKDSTSYKKRIGYVPESGDIYDSLTAIEYLSFIGELYGMTPDLSYERSRELLRLFDLEDSMNSSISSYSKGMKQKVLIISALINNPDLIFLDEPLNGMDANSVMVFKEVLEELSRKGTTIFYSSHIMEVVEKLSHRIILIDGGRVIADGSFEELKSLSSKGSLESIFNDLTGFDQHRERAREIVSLVGSYHG